MAVPNLPFWCSAANKEFQEHNHGWMSTTGSVAEVGSAYWISTLAGRANSLPIGSGNFSMSGHAAGQAYGGGGPAGQPGWSETGQRLTAVVGANGYRSQNHGGKYSFNRDLAVFGYGVTERHLAAAGLSLGWCVGTSRALRWHVRAVVDHEYEFGFFSFHKNRPWSGSYATLLSGVEGGKGRQWIDKGLNYWKAPPAHHIVVPYLRTHSGEHDITFTISTY